MRAMRMTPEGLVEAYHTYGCPPESWRVGAEFERHLLDERGAPLPYFGTPGVRWLLERIEKLGWEPTFEGDNPIALFRDGAWITLEPGSQFELSGAPYRDVVGVDAELASFNRMVDEQLEGTGIHQVALGYTPVAPLDSIPWVPKGRYVVMREHLHKTGPLAHNMMKGTCATQASYDFSGEADCAEMVGLATRFGPLTTALFANSPLLEGQDSGYATYRGYIWTQTDPRRTGFPEAAENFTFQHWVDYLLDVPMMFVRQGHAYVPAKGRTFRDWLADPVHPPTKDDWELHLTSVFPEVRIKRTIEVRGADCVSRPLAMAFTALFEGLFYADDARSRALELAGAFSSGETVVERFEIACRRGLAGTVGGRPLHAWAAELYEAAQKGLERIRPQDVKFLKPLVPLIERGESPAAEVLRAWRADPSIPALLSRQHVDG